MLLLVAGTLADMNTDKGTTGAALISDPPKYADRLTTVVPVYVSIGPRLISVDWRLQVLPVTLPGPVHVR